MNSATLPAAIDAEQGERLREDVRKHVIGKVQDHFPNLATSYATGHCEVDAEGCGPGMWLNARGADDGDAFHDRKLAVIHAEAEQERVRNDEKASRAGARGGAHGAAVPVVRRVPRRDRHSTRQQDEGGGAARCEDPLRVDETEMWPVPQKLEEAGDQTRIQEFILKRKPVVAFLAVENSIPTRQYGSDAALRFGHVRRRIGQRPRSRSAESIGMRLYPVVAVREKVVEAVLVVHGHYLLYYERRDTKTP